MGRRKALRLHFEQHNLTPMPGCLPGGFATRKTGTNNVDYRGLHEEMQMIRLLKNTHLRRCAHHLSLRCTVKYASFLLISRALHLNVFEQPVKKYFFENRLFFVER